MPTSDSTEPTWATDTNYTTGARTGSPLKVLAPTGEAAQGIVAGNPLFGAYLNALFNKMIAWQLDAGRGVFGDGSAGDLTMSAGTTTLAGPMSADNLIVPNGATIATNGYPIFVRNLLTIESGGIIQGNGGAGLAGNGSGRTGGTAGAGNYYGSGGAGGASGVGVAGTAGTSVSSAVGGAGGAGGASNDTGSDASEAGGTGGAILTVPDMPFAALPWLLELHSPAGTAHRGGAGGGGGGGGDLGDGGSGGGGGGIVIVVAFRAVLAGTGCIRADGGAGGAAYTGPDALGNGGGGGGGGGLAALICRGRSGSGTLRAAGGAGGAGYGVGSNGVAGSAGRVIELFA